MKVIQVGTYSRMHCDDEYGGPACLKMPTSLPSSVRRVGAVIQTPHKSCCHQKLKEFGRNWRLIWCVSRVNKYYPSLTTVHAIRNYFPCQLPQPQLSLTGWRRHTNPAQKLLPSEIEGVRQKLAVDLVCIEGQQVLSIVDYGSRYPELLPLSATTTTAVIDRLMEVFARFGLPSVLVSDNGPQFASAEMAQFLQRLGIQHNRSSPRYPRSNGMVERLHRVVKERIQSLGQSLSLQRHLQQVLFDIRNSVH